MITDETENALLHRRVIVRPDSPKYPNNGGLIVGISGTDEVFAHVDMDAHQDVPHHRREMFPVEDLTVLPKGR